MIELEVKSFHFPCGFAILVMRDILVLKQGLAQFVTSYTASYGILVYTHLLNQM